MAIHCGVTFQKLKSTQKTLFLASLRRVTRRGQHELSLREGRCKKILRCRTEQSQCTHTGYSVAK